MLQKMFDEIYDNNKSEIIDENVLDCSICHYYAK